MAPLRYAAKFDPFLSLDCAPDPQPRRNPRKGRDQILPSGNLAFHPIPSNFLSRFMGNRKRRKADGRTDGRTSERTVVGTNVASPFYNSRRRTKNRLPSSAVSISASAVGGRSENAARTPSLPDILYLLEACTGWSIWI